MFQIYIVAVTYITYWMAGVSRSYCVFLVPQLQSNSSDIPITLDEGSWLVCLSQLPCIIGCTLGGYLMDIIGRKYSLIWLFSPFVVGWALIAKANHIVTLYCGMFFSSVGAGMAFSSITYVSEICTAEHRGPMLAILEPVFAMGMLFCNVTVYWFQWRISAFTFLILSNMFFLLFFLIPESPSWLVSKGRKEEAVRILCWLRDSEIEADREILDIEMSNERKKGCRLLDTVIGLTSSWKATLILLSAYTIQQGVGLHIIVGYTAIFFNELRFPIDASIAAIISSVVFFLGSLATPIFMKLFKRRTCIAVSAFGMGVCFSVVAIYQTIFYTGDEKPFFLVPLISIYISNIFGCLGVFILALPMSGELFPKQIRSLDRGIYYSLSYLISSIVLKMFPSYLSKFGMVIVLWTFVFFSFIHIPFVIFIMPETKGKTSNEIQEE